MFFLTPQRPYNPITWILFLLLKALLKPRIMESWVRELHTGVYWWWKCGHFWLLSLKMHWEQQIPSWLLPYSIPCKYLIVMDITMHWLTLWLGGTAYFCAVVCGWLLEASWILDNNWHSRADAVQLSADMDVLCCVAPR